MRPPDFVFPRARPLLATLLLVSATACAPHAAHSRPLAMGGAADPSAGLPASNAPGRSIDDTQKSKSQLDAPLQEFAKRIGVVCDTDSGKLTCIGGKPENGDYYNVDLHPDCGSGGKFGAVLAVATELRDKIAPLDEQTNAILAPGQLVCIEATGWIETHPSYYYVVQMPRTSVAICNSADRCAGLGDRAVNRHGRTATTRCTAENGLPSAGCAEGWVRGERISAL